MLVSALLHLAAAGGLLVASPWTDPFTVRWDLLLWILLLGFVGFTTSGFALHLFPTLSRRPAPPPWAPQAVFLLGEAGFLLGAVGLAGVAPSGAEEALRAIGGALLAGGQAVVLGLFLRELAGPRLGGVPPSQRPGDAPALPLFLGAWTSGVLALTLIVLSAFTPGPGFGWWLAGVHLFVLGHAILLITAVNLRLTPRFLDADAPRVVTAVLAGLALLGAATVPVGMLVSSPTAATPVVLGALPEAAFAGLFVAWWVHLFVRARTRRVDAGLALAALLLLLPGGALGLSMVAAAAYDSVEPHALLNVLGFVGLTILVMWFTLLAPFQRIAHAWTRRMLGILSGAWLAGTLLAVTAGSGRAAGPSVLGAVAGGLLLAVAGAWAAGTVPVLFPGRPARPTEIIEGDGRRPEHGRAG